MRPELQQLTAFVVPEIFQQLDDFLHTAAVIENLSLQVVEIQLKPLLVGSVKRDGHEVGVLSRHVVLVGDANNPLRYFRRERSGM